MTTPVIEARGLSKVYRGGRRALDAVNLTVQPGRIVGLIGPNGAGKTTALKALLGLTPFDGELRVLGMDPQRQRDALDVLPPHQAGSQVEGRARYGGERHDASGGHFWATKSTASSSTRARNFSMPSDCTRILMRAL